MILVLDNEVDADYRYLAPEIADIVTDSEYRVFVDDPVVPELNDVDGVILSGSTASVYDESHAEWIEKEVELVEQCMQQEIPLLGVCFGHQLINYALGGRVVKDRRRSTFVELIEFDDDDPILEGVNPIHPVLHADIVVKPGTGMESIGRTEYNEYFCTRHTSHSIWTAQSHPEYTERIRDKGRGWEDGGFSFDECNTPRLLQNFAEICGRTEEGHVTRP